MSHQVAHIAALLERETSSPNNASHSRRKRKVERFDAHVQKWDLPIKYKFDPNTRHSECCPL